MVAASSLRVTGTNNPDRQVSVTRWNQLMDVVGSVAFTPEENGAAGDGVTNDTIAFQAIASAINAAGGGVINLKPGATYAVGLQDLVNDGTWMFKGQPILYLHGCANGIVIRGNGAKFKYAGGLKFGTFNSSGASTSHSLPYSGGDKSAPVDSTSNAIISLVGNSGAIEIENLELDGNVSGLSIGGDYGDTGKQLPGDALFLSGNTGRVRITNVYGHHCPRDGLQADATGANATGNDIPRYPHTFTNCTFDLNCRNNVSYRGGRGVKFIGLNTTNAGSGTLPFASSPRSCFDAESEAGSIRDLSFEDCTFSNGAGTSFVSDQVDVDGLFFKRCTLDNPTGWAAYVQTIPNVVLEDCRIFGAFHYADPSDITRAARFVRCRFTDLDADSLTGAPISIVGAFQFDGAGGGAHGVNVTFDRCTWVSGTHIGPYNGTGSIFTDCQMDNAGVTYLAGLHSSVFRGVNTINSATFDFSTSLGSKIIGTAFRNGTQRFYGSATYDPPSLATAAGATTTVTATDAVVGQKADATFSNALQGVRMFAWVSAADTVSVRFENNTGGTIDLASGTLKVRVTDIDAA